MGRVLPEAKFENRWTLFFELFLFERPLLTRDWKSESVTDGPTDQPTYLLTWVGARVIYSSIGYLVLWRRPWAVTPCHKRGRLRVEDSVQSSKLEKTHLKTQRSIWKKNRVKKLPQKKVTGKLSWKKQRQHMWPERRRSSVKPRTNRNEFLLCFDQWEAKLMRCTFEKVLT